VRRLAALLVAAALAGCGSSPPTQFYALESVAASHQPPPLRGPPLALDAVHLPPVLDRLPLVRRGPGASLEISERERWGAPLDEMTRRVLARDLEQRLPPGGFITPGAPKPAGGVRSITVTLDEFDLDEEGRAVAQGSWTLTSPKSGRAADHQPIDIRSEDRAKPQAEAMSDVLATLADRIVARVAAGAGR
jgi:hypothetical protein